MDALARAGRARRAIVSGEGLGESLVCAGGDFFRCHGAVGFAGVGDGFADLGFGFFLFAQALGGGGGFGGEVYLSVAGEVGAESAFASGTGLGSSWWDGGERGLGVFALDERGVC